MMITEAMAELKTIGKRLEKKRQAILTFVARQDGIKDPLLKDGGSALMIEKEMQSITDLEVRIIELRRGIAKANDETTISINGTDMTISEWLTWRREVAPGVQQFYAQLRAHINAYRDRAQKAGAKVLAKDEEAGTPNDIVINLDEGRLIRDSEHIENTLGQLDGQLSLKNATTLVQLD